MEEKQVYFGVSPQHYHFKNNSKSQTFLSAIVDSMVPIEMTVVQIVLPGRINNVLTVNKYDNGQVHQTQQVPVEHQDFWPLLLYFENVRPLLL